MRLPHLHAHERLPVEARHELPDSSRSDCERLLAEAQRVGQSPAVTALLDAVDAIILVLNQRREILALNRAAMDLRRGADLLGLRPGEAIFCVNSLGAGGWGTAPACADCGALGAIVRSQATGRPVEAECLVRSGDRAGAASVFNVRASQLGVEGARLTVLTLRDISSEKRAS